MSTISPITLSDFHGLPALQLQSGDGARATVLLHGAHLVSWVPAGGEERLYLSPRALLDGRQAIRGGVPVIFPQFNQRGPLPRHGFARTSRWRALSLEQGANDALAVLRLVDDEATRAVWPQRFIAELTLRITGARLDIELAVEHPEPDEAGPPGAALQFTAALHTYLRVADAARARLDGLQRLRYIDSVRNTQQLDMAPQLVADGELDRIYFDAARPLTLHDDGPVVDSAVVSAVEGVGERVVERVLERVVEISQTGFVDAVVWNPGAERCAALADMPADGWREMLCVEAAVIGVPVSLSPGEAWIGRQTLTLLSGEEAAANDSPTT